MSTTDSSILVIEDEKEHSQELIKELSKLSTPAEDFESSYGKYKTEIDAAKSKINSELTDEKIFAQFMQSATLQKVSLCFVDSELGKYRTKQELPILDKDSISRACSDLGIPVCIYSEAADDFDLERLSDWSQHYIVVPRQKSYAELARLGKAISEGFEHIRTGFTVDDIGKGDSLGQLGKILKMPDDAYSHLGLYSIGQISSLPLKYPKGASDAEVRDRIKSMSIGYWLYNSVLRYPGILMNTTALGSYLDIDPKYLLETSGIMGTFDDAKYEGPFNEVEPFWWKSEIEALLVEYPGESARDYLISKGFSEEIPRATCIESGKTDNVGYYCIATNKPVCEEHSAGGHSWLPGGAVLSRISKKIWEELSPHYAL